MGGFQGGEGAGGAAEWNVENVFEELDAPNEYYYDTATKDLYENHPYNIITTRLAIRLFFQRFIG